MFAKIVISESGKMIGYVLDNFVDVENMTKSGYYVVDEETENEMILKNENIVCENEKYIFVDDVSKIEFVANRDFGFVGKRIFGENYIDLGIVEDVIFQKNKITKFITDKAEICARFVQKIGADCLFFKNMKKKQTNFFKQKGDYKLDEIMIKMQEKTKEIENSYLPPKINLSSKFFIGKIAMQDVFGYNNERIVLKGEIISKLIFEKAKKHNKLNHLFFAVNSK